MHMKKKLQARLRGNCWTRGTLEMGNDLGGGGQRIGKKLRKAKTASAPEENTKPRQSRWNREWKPCAASSGSQSGSQKRRAWKPSWKEPLTGTAYHTWLVCRRSCTNWKGKLEWTRQHSHHRKQKSGWSKRKHEELGDGNEWSGHKLNHFG